MLVAVVEVDQRQEEVVPAPDDREQADGGQDRLDQGQHERHVDLQVVGTVDQRRLLQLAGDDGADVGAHHQDVPGAEAGQQDDDQPRVHQSELVDQQVRGDEVPGQE